MTNPVLYSFPRKPRFRLHHLPGYALCLPLLLSGSLCLLLLLLLGTIIQTLMWLIYTPFAHFLHLPSLSSFFLQD